MRSAMRIAFRGRPFYAHSQGVEGVAPEGAGSRWYRPPTFGSSFLCLPVARPTDSSLGFGRVRGARKVDAFSVAFFSLPRGDGTSRPQSFGSGFSPAGSKARVGPDRGASGHQASFPLGTQRQAL